METLYVNDGNLSSRGLIILENFLQLFNKYSEQSFLMEYMQTLV